MTAVGHSVGGALALLDALLLSRQLNQIVKAITYGMPRVGNQAFADFVDGNVPLTHINNKEDLSYSYFATLVSWLPSRFWRNTHSRLRHLSFMPWCVDLPLPFFFKLIVLFRGV